MPNVLLAEDGYVIDLIDGHAAITGAFECGYVYVDGSSVGDLTESELKDRRILGDEGFISVVVVIDSTTGKIVTGPEIHARGLAEEDSVFDEVQPGSCRDRGGAERRCPRLPPARTGDAPHARLVRRPQPQAPPDDHPDRPRGLRHHRLFTHRKLRCGEHETQRT